MQAEVIPFAPSRRRGRGRTRPKLATADQATPGLPLSAAWDSWLVAMRALNLSEQTIEVYHLVTRTFGASLDTADECRCAEVDGDERPCPVGVLDDLDHFPACPAAASTSRPPR